MSDEIKSVRDAANTIRSIRREIRIYTGVAAFVAVIAIGFVGWAFDKGFDKIDRLEELTVRLDTRLEGIEKKLDTIVADTTAIRSTVQTASAAPISPSIDSFDGWVGVQAQNDQANTFPAITKGKFKDAWIYVPADQESN